MTGEEPLKPAREPPLDPQARDGAKGFPDAVEAERQFNDLEAATGSSHGSDGIPDWKDWTD